MKKLATVMALALLVPAIAHAGTYTNKTYNMSFDYPTGWKLSEMQMPTAGSMAGHAASQSASQRFGGIDIARPEGFVSGGEIASQAIDAGIGTAQDTATAAVGGAIVESMIKKHMPKFMSVTLTNSAKPGTQIMVTGVEGMAAPAGTTGAAGTGGGSGKTECKMLPSETKSWGGKSVKVISVRCPQDGEWQYTATASMKRGGADFFIVGMMTAASDEEFNNYIQSAFDQILASTRFN